MFSLRSMIFPHYFSVSHPSVGFGLFAVIAVPPTIKNLTSYGDMIFFSSCMILTTISTENVNLSFSNNDLIIFKKRVYVNILFIFLTLSNLPGAVFSTDLSNKSM